MEWQQTLSQLQKVVNTARNSKRVVKFLLAFVFFVFALITVTNLITANERATVLVGVALLAATFSIRFILEIAPARLVFWFLALVVWVASLTIVVFSGITTTNVIFSVALISGFAVIFISIAPAAVFATATIIAVVLFQFQDQWLLANAAAVNVSWANILFGALFGLAGAVMIALSEMEAPATAAGQQQLHKLQVNAKSQNNELDDVRSNIRRQPGGEQGVPNHKIDFHNIASQAEDDLKSVALRYQAFFENNTDGVIILGPDGIVVDISELAARMLGYSISGLIGKSVLSLVPEKERETFGQMVGRIAAGEQVNIFSHTLLRQNGTSFPVEVNAGVVRDTDGKPVNIQVLFRDITNRNRVEIERQDLLDNLRMRTRQIQTAFEVSKSISSTLDFGNLLSQTVEIIKQRFDFYYVGVFIVDDKFAILAAGSGEQGRKMLLAGHRLQIAPSSMVGWCIENRRARIAHDVGKDPVHFDNPLTPDTRSELAMPLIIRSEVIGALTVQSDYPEAFNSEDVAVLQIMADQLAIAVQNARLHETLTEYAEELEDRVLQRTFQLEELNEELESFSYSISHDLRAPLRAIHGFSNIILDSHEREMSDQVRNYFGKINSNALRMGKLIDDILSFSRMGRQKIRKVELDPNELVLEVLSDHVVEVSERGIQTNVDTLPMVKADPTLLKQVFANLISNAIKFTRATTEPVVTIGCAHEDGSSVIFVKDNGVGFDMKYSERIFGVFQRMHRDDEFEGTGVGLAIVQRIIFRHGGDIWFEAEKGEGAAFYFRLPA